MFKQIKELYKYCYVNKKIVICQVFSIIFINVLTIAFPLLFSQSVNACVDKSYYLATIYLSISFGCLILKHLLWHINYANYPHMVANSYKQMQEKIIDKMINATKLYEFEKLSYVVNNDIFTLSNFTDNFIIKLGHLFRAVVIIIIIACYNWLVAVLLIFFTIINYLFLLIYNKKKKNISGMMYNTYQSIDKQFDEIYEKKEVINSLDLKNSTQQEHMRRINEYVNLFSKNNSLKSIKDNWLQIFWALVLFGLSYLIMVNFINYYISLSVFLFLTDYINMFSSGTDKILDFRVDILELSVALERYKQVLAVQAEPKQTFAGTTGDIELKLVSKYIFYKGSKYFNRLNLTVGNMAVINYSDVTKDLVDNLTNLKSETDNVFVNGMSVVNFTHQEFNNFINVVNKSTPLFSDSILKNFMIFNKNKQEIKQLLYNQFGLKIFIKSLPIGLDSILDEEIYKKHNYEMLKINLARAFLTKNSIIVIMVDFKLKNKTEFLTIIKKLLKTKIIIIIDKAENNFKTDYIICNNLSDYAQTNKK